MTIYTYAAIKAVAICLLVFMVVYMTNNLWGLLGLLFLPQITNNEDREENK